MIWPVGIAWICFTVNKEPLAYLHFGSCNGNDVDEE